MAGIRTSSFPSAHLAGNVIISALAFACTDSPPLPDCPTTWDSLVISQARGAEVQAVFEGEAITHKGLIFFGADTLGRPEGGAASWHIEVQGGLLLPLPGERQSIAKAIRPPWLYSYARSAIEIACTPDGITPDFSVTAVEGVLLPEPDSSIGEGFRLAYDGVALSEFAVSEVPDNFAVYPDGAGPTVFVRTLVVQGQLLSR